MPTTWKTYAVRDIVPTAITGRARRWKRGKASTAARQPTRPAIATPALVMSRGPCGIRWFQGRTGPALDAPALGHDTELTRLPWVGHTSRRWEAEPLRWLGGRYMYLAYSRADRKELAGRQRASRLVRLADVISRRP
ncbi:hypothetical protein [Streptomyces sp. NPDC008137]|uniref:hypothetical protein n=1 Tax=Streptomyces sp. NPDC008137 TaxID=3364813 RepID=UPI0036EFF864